MSSLRRSTRGQKIPGIVALTALLAGLPWNTPTDAQLARSGYSLPLSLAVEAAAEAIRTCEAGGYNVTATVVDSSALGLAGMLASAAMLRPGAARGVKAFDDAVASKHRIARNNVT